MPDAGSTSSSQPVKPLEDGGKQPQPPRIESTTPENRNNTVNPSAPEDSNTTPGTTTDK